MLLVYVTGSRTSQFPWHPSLPKLTLQGKTPRRIPILYIQPTAKCDWYDFNKIILLYLHYLPHCQTLLSRISYLTYRHEPRRPARLCYSLKDIKRKAPHVAGNYQHEDNNHVSHFSSTQATLPLGQWSPKFCYILESPGEMKKILLPSPHPIAIKWGWHGVRAWHQHF